MIEKSIETGHMQKLTMDSRKQLTLNGVKDIDSFSDREVVLITNMGKLTIKGENLKISKMVVDTGDFSVAGLITSLVYSKSSQSSKGGVFEKLFK